MTRVTASAFGLSRRAFLTGGALVSRAAGQGRATVADHSRFLDVARLPDRVTVFLENETLDLQRTGTRWLARDVVVATEPQHRKLAVALAAPRSAVLRVRLRWQAPVRPGWRFLGDAWERSYGDLEWRALAGERIMPWYFLATDGRTTRGCGVMTGAAAICFWQVDSAGVTLWLDVRNGGSGVRLGHRQLEAATVVALGGNQTGPVFRAAQSFCRAMCDRPRLPRSPVWRHDIGSQMLLQGFEKVELRPTAAHLQTGQTHSLLLQVRTQPIDQRVADPGDVIRG